MQPRSPTVGVVVPAYRDSALLPMALQSISEQTYPLWQCVVVDDASPEDVGSVVAAFSENDQRFQLLRHGANGGLSAARNTGTRHLTTDLVMYLDADDMIVPGALQAAVAKFARHWDEAGVAGVHGQIVLVPEETSLRDVRSWTGRYPRSRVDWARYTGECPFNVHAVVLRRSLVESFGGFDETILGGAEDWDLWLRLLRHGYRFEPNAHLMGAYRQRRASMFRDRGDAHVERAARLFDAADEIARLDPTLVTGLGGAQPLSQARLALFRAKRAAARIGLEIGGSGTLDPIDESTAYRLLDIGALTEGTQTDITESAKNGLVRGLGITRPLVAELPAAMQQRINEVAALVTSAIVSRESVADPREPTYDAAPRRTQVDLLLAAPSVAEVARLLPLLSSVPSQLAVAAVDLDIVGGDSGATTRWREVGIDVVEYHRVAIGHARTRMLAFCEGAVELIGELVRPVEEAGGVVRLLPVAHAPERTGAESASNPVAALLAGLAGEPNAETTERWRPAAQSIAVADLVRNDGPFDAASAERLGGLRDRHRGETCIVIGDDRPVDPAVIDRVAHLPMFGANGIISSPRAVTASLAFFVVDDAAVADRSVDAITALDATWRFLPAASRIGFRGDVDERMVFVRMNEDHRSDHAIADPTRFSLDPTLRVYRGRSVTFVALQLVHWLGFRHVVLLGVDPAVAAPGALADYRRVDEIYRATGRTIVNTTDESAEGAFTHCSLRDALADVAPPSPGTDGDRGPHDRHA